MELVNGKWRWTEAERQIKREQNKNLIWITDGIKCKRHPEDQQIPAGFQKGRPERDRRGLLKGDGANNHSAEANAKRSLALRGKPSNSLGHISPKRDLTEADYYGQEKADDLARSRSEIHSGKAPWNDGVSHSEETKDQISQTKLTSNGIGKYVGFRDGAKGKAWAIKVFNRDSIKCQHCGKDKQLAAHHIKDYETYEELRLVESNGLTLCNRCHFKLELALRIIKVNNLTLAKVVIDTTKEICTTCHRLTERCKIEEIKPCCCNPVLG